MILLLEFNPYRQSLDIRFKTTGNELRSRTVSGGFEGVLVSPGVEDLILLL
jgi:hypothetical protein